MSNGNGGAKTPASGFPVSGGGPPIGGPSAIGPVGQDQGPPSAGTFGGPGDIGPAPGGQGGQVGLPVPVTPVGRPGGAPSGGADGAGSAGSAGSTARKGSRWALSNWRVRWRLIAIIAVPTATALILGAIQIGHSVSNYSSFKRIQTLANLNALVVTGAGQLADERDDTAGYVASGKRDQTMSATVTKDQAATTVTLHAIQDQAEAIAEDGGYRQQTVLDLNNGVLAGIADLTYIRKAALTTSYPALAIIQSYDRLVTAFDTLSNDVAAGTGNATLETDVSVLNAVLRMEDDASLQRAYLYQALASPQPGLSAAALAALTQAATQQQADKSQFIASAPVAQAQLLNNTVAGPQVDEAQSAEKRAIASTNSGSGLTIGTQQSCGSQSPAQCWYSTQSAQIKQLRQVSDGLVRQVSAQANAL